MDTKQLNTSPVCAEVSLFAQDPLPHNEVRDIAKSISKWTATHHTPEKFSAVQTNRIQKRWQYRLKDQLKGLIEEKKMLKTILEMDGL